MDPLNVARDDARAWKKKYLSLVDGHSALGTRVREAEAKVQKLSTQGAMFREIQAFATDAAGSIERAGKALRRVQDKMKLYAKEEQA